MAEISDKHLQKHLREQEREAARLCLEAGQAWTSPGITEQVTDPDLRREFDLIARKRGEIEQFQRSIEEIRAAVIDLADGDRGLRRLRRELRRAIHENRRYHKSLGQAGYRAFRAAFAENSGDWERWRHIFSEVMLALDEREDLEHEAAYLQGQMVRQHVLLRLKTWLSLCARRWSLRVQHVRLGWAYKLAGARIIEFHFASVAPDPEMEDILSLLEHGDSATRRVRTEMATIKEQRLRLERVLEAQQVIGAGDRGRIAVLESECRRLETDIENIQREVGQIGFMKGLNDTLNVPAVATAYRRLAEVYQAMRPTKSRLGYPPDPVMGQFRSQRVDLGPTGVARPASEEELEAAGQTPPEPPSPTRPGAFPLRTGSALHGVAPLPVPEEPPRTPLVRGASAPVRDLSPRDGSARASPPLPDSSIGESDDDPQSLPEDVTISLSDGGDARPFPDADAEWGFDDPRFAPGKERDEHAP